MLPSHEWQAQKRGNTSPLTYLLEVLSFTILVFSLDQFVFSSISPQKKAVACLYLFWQNTGCKFLGKLCQKLIGYIY